MPNGLYVKAGEGLLKGRFDLEVNKLKAILVDLADYPLDRTNDEFLSHIPAPARVATSPVLTSTSINGAVFDAGNTVFPGVAGDTSELVVIARYAATTADADLPDGQVRLVAVIDTASGLALTPNGGDVTCTWNDGANKIFRLVIPTS